MAADPVGILEDHVNYHERANNCNIFSDYLNHPCEAWCGDTVTACYKMAGVTLPSMQPGLASGYASVWYGYTWADRNGLTVPSWEAVRNDAVCFQWDGQGIHGNANNMHTALVIDSGPKGTLLHYIGGNQHDQVSEGTIAVGSDLIIGCIKLSTFLETAVPTPPHPAPTPHHPPHPHQPSPTPHTVNVLGRWHPNWPTFMVKTPLMHQHAAVVHWQHRMIDRGWHRVPAHTPYIQHAGRRLTADGIYGPDCAAVAWAFQDEKGLTRDGKLGPQTWIAAGRTDNVT